jgi:oligoribonuclease NrnB/cAMP/cGMP phosphodiesterase (DHH superfamily)
MILMKISKIVLDEVAEKEKKEHLNKNIELIDMTAKRIKEINPSFDQEAFVIKIMPVAEKCAADMVDAMAPFKKALFDSLEEGLTKVEDK